MANIINKDFLSEEDINTLELSNILLPNKWILYIYDKSLFRKISSRQNFIANPHKKIYEIVTVNDIIYIMKLFDVENNIENNKVKNIDVNSYIIMRDGIEPIWEDPKNKNGGTFTIKIENDYSYSIWVALIMYMMGETLTFNMDQINGISISYLFDTKNIDEKNYSLIKIWDAEKFSTVENFISLIPKTIYDEIKDASLRYTLNNAKKHYGRTDIIDRIHDKKFDKKRNSRGGFSNRRR